MSGTYILLVEDRDEDIELTLRAFKRAHILNEVVVKRDGVEALAFLEGLVDEDGPRMPPPTLILLDVDTPRMNGITLLEKIRKLGHLRYVPVVMLTSSNEERDLSAAYDHGANSYIRKPVRHTAFTALVERLGMYWSVTNQTPRGL